MILTLNRHSKTMSNFCINVIGHSFQKEQENVIIHILECKMSSKKHFHIEIVGSDLDSFAAFYSKFNKRRRPDALLNEKFAKEGRIQEHLAYIIEEYEASGSRKFITVASHEGFYYNKEADSCLYVLGPKTQILLSHNAAPEKIKKSQIVWLGNNKVNNIMSIGEKVSKDDTMTFLKLLEKYHHSNFTSILVLLSYTHLIMNRHNLNLSISIPSVHITGDASTGKTTMIKHFKLMMPYMEEDGIVTQYKDNDTSLWVLKDMLIKTRPPIIYDSAPSYSNNELNQIIENFYEGNIYTGRKCNAKQKSVISTGLVMIWEHEKYSLPDLKPTSLSKIIWLRHVELEIKEVEEMATLHNDILSWNKKASGIFCSLLNPVDLKYISKAKASFQTQLRNDLINQYKNIDKFGLLIENYSLILAGLDHWCLGLCCTPSEKNELLYKLYHTFKTISVPQNILRCQGEMLSIHESDDYLLEILIKHLEMLTVNEFFSKVGLGKQSLNISFDLFKSGDSKVKKAKKLFDRKYSEARAFFPIITNETQWFKRSNLRTIYGKYSKLTSYRVPYEVMDQKLHVVVQDKIKAFIPELKIPLQNNNNYHDIVQTYFDQKYQFVITENEIRQVKPHDEEINKIFWDIWQMPAEEKIQFIECYNKFKSGK
jgi:hypothetical protein